MGKFPFLTFFIFIYAISAPNIGLANQLEFKCSYNQSPQKIDFTVNIETKTLRMQIKGNHEHQQFGQGEFQVKGTARYLEGMTPPHSRLVEIYLLDAIHQFRFSPMPRPMLKFHFIDVDLEGVASCSRT